MNGRYIIVLRLVMCLLATVTLVCGCRTTKYVEVPKVHTEYKTLTDTLRDSIYHDVLVKEYIKGDTIHHDRIEYIYKDKWHSKTDTVLKVDTITKVVTLEKKSIVESAVNKFLEVVVIILLLLIALYTLYKWLKSKHVM